MKIVIWTDEKGWRHRSVIKDDHDESMAPKGIQQDPPRVEDLNWEDIKRDLHNALVNRGLIGYRDIIRQQDGVTGAILAALRKPVIDLYKERRGRDGVE